MATTTAAPATTTPATTTTPPTLLSTAEADVSTDVQAVEKTVKADATTALSWMQKHERIILTALVLTAGSWFGDHWLNITAAKDKQQATIAIAQVDEQKTKDTQLAQQVSQLSTQYQTTVTQLTAQNAQLAKAASSRTVVLQQQQAADSTMALPALGDRWAQLADIAPADITNTPTGVTVTPTGARKTVSQLEQVPVLQANLAGAQTAASNDQEELAKANGLVTSQTTQIAGLNKTVTDQDVSCKAQVASAKATANKAKSRWFKVGFIGGAIVGFLAGHKF